MGRRVLTRDALGRETHFSYNAAGDLVRVEYPGGRVFSYEYNTAGDRVKVTDPMGNVSEYDYDPRHNKTLSTNPRGFSTQVSFDAMDRATLIQYPIGSESYTYDPQDHVLSMTNAVGLTSRKVYDPAGNLIKDIDTGGNETSYTYDCMGHRITLTDPEGNTWRFEYDSLYRLTATVDPLGNRRSSEYDPAGNRIASTDENGLRSTFSYDALGRLTESKDPIGNSSTSRYDTAGNLIESTDPLGRSFYYFYDRLNRLIRTVDPEALSTSRTYNDAGFVNFEIDRAGRSTSMEYDAAGRLIRRTRENYPPEIFEYDTNGNLVRHTRMDGSVVEKQYDARDGVTAVDAPGDDEDVSFSLDPLGRAVYTENPLSFSQLAYDSSGRVSARTEGFKFADMGLARLEIGAGFGYNKNGMLTEYTFTMPDAAGRPALFNGGLFEYDPLSRLTKGTYKLGGVTSEILFSYDPASRLTRMTTPDGATAAFDYDDASRLNHMAETNPALPHENLTDRSLTRDPAGKITAASDARDGTTSYSYDPLDRLTAAGQPAALAPVLPDESYSYDPAGNRTRSTTGAHYDPATRQPAPVDYSYSALPDQLSEDSRFYYSYDARGNLSQKVRKSDGRTTRYEYSPHDRLAKVSLFQYDWSETPFRSVAYTFDWAGRRIQKTVFGADGVPAATTKYLYQGDNLAAEFDEKHRLLALYRHAPGTLDAPFAMERAGRTFFYHYDERGSVIYLTNEAGQKVKEYRYDTFGRIVLENGDIENPFTYTGREYDPESGLYHYRARAYDAESGRFLQHDPVYSANPYPYVNNDPVNRKDPMGEDDTATVPAVEPGMGIMNVAGAEDYPYCYTYDDPVKGAIMFDPVLQPELMSMPGAKPIWQSRPNCGNLPTTGETASKRACPGCRLEGGNYDTAPPAKYRNDFNACFIYCCGGYIGDCNKHISGSYETTQDAGIEFNKCVEKCMYYSPVKVEQYSGGERARAVRNNDNKCTWSGTFVETGGFGGIYGKTTSVGTISNWNTGERCVFTMKCTQWGIGATLSIAGCSLWLFHAPCDSSGLNGKTMGVAASGGPFSGGSGGNPNEDTGAYIGECASLGPGGLLAIETCQTTIHDCE